MENTLLGVGIACVIAAIVGGGLKAFGMEIPLVNSNKRQLLLSLFGLVLIAVSIAQGDGPLIREADISSKTKADARPRPNLSYGTWTLHKAIDDAGKNWSNSTLRFTSQEETSDGLMLRGAFDWRLENIEIGTEEFTGHYVEAKRQIFLEGNAIKEDAHPGQAILAIGSYSAVVSLDERSLVDGRWGSTMQNDPGAAGKWEATR
jgi:hypothetical protein